MDILNYAKKGILTLNNSVKNFLKTVIKSKNLY